MLSEKSEDSERSWPVPEHDLSSCEASPCLFSVLTTLPFHGSNQGSEAHMLSPGGPLWEASKRGGSGGSLNTVCHFCKFGFCFLFCFASWLLTLRNRRFPGMKNKGQITDAEAPQRSVKPQREAAPGGAASPTPSAWVPSPHAGRFQLSQKEHKSPMALHCREDWGGGLISVNTSSNQPNKKPNTLQNTIESRVSTRYHYVEDTILMSRHKKKWEYKIHTQGESNQWRLISDMTGH